MEAGHVTEESSPAVREGSRHNTTASGRKRLLYDDPATPYTRLLASGALDEKTKERLAEEHARLNPARITRRINAIQTELIQPARHRTQSGQIQAA